MTSKYNPFYRTKPKMIYIPDHWGRLDQGKWVENGNFSPPPKRGSREYLDLRNLFHITTSIGDRGTNKRADVGKLEALLYMAGVYDLDPTGGPTGYYGERLKLAAKDFQKSHGLTVDGNINPGGETIRALAQHLQDMDRRGGPVLAHLTPEEARFLRKNTDGGSINPQTGLIEFNVAGKKEGSYIWRTVGDGKVRSSHADRDGKVFSWDNPPEGGHPGEDYNCRCRAEDVKENKKDCEKIRLAMEAAYRRHDDLHKPILYAEKDVSDIKKILVELMKERKNIMSEIMAASFPTGLKFNPLGAAATLTLIAMLKQKRNEKDVKIKKEKQTLAIAKEKLAQLERKRKNLTLNAEEFSRRYKACLEKSKASRK